jgi:type IV fimbrial biogenesis protein FimT
MSPDRQSGFTLIELMVAIAVIAVMMGIALPSFQQSLRSNRVATSANEMLASLSLARTEAIRGLGRAGVCPSADGTTCAANTDWSGGWIVWREDRVGGGLVKSTVRYVQAKGKMVISGPGDTDGITFNTQGRAEAGARTLDLSPEGVETPARCVLVGATGQTRITQGACQ